METTPNPPLKNIFISYRERDTAGETGRLADTLKQYFSTDQVFMDIDKLEPGVDFTEVISSSLDACDVMLAVIGPDWEGVNPTTKASRIKDTNDWVALEISTALKRKIRVVPILVNGGKLPASADLPEELQALLRRQTYEISNKRWAYDTQQLIGFLEKSIGIIPKGKEDAAAKTVAATPPLPPAPTSSGKMKWVVMLAALLIIGSGVAYYIISDTNENANTQKELKSLLTEIDSLKDSDSDGVADVKDKELMTAKGSLVDKDGVAKADTTKAIDVKDSDGDGVPDNEDKQLHTPKGWLPVDENGVGKQPAPVVVQPARDSDGDGVPDNRDKEPATKKECFPTDRNGVGKCPPPVVKDADGDGVPDDRDKEPATKKECLPADKDGVGKCPDPSPRPGYIYDPVLHRFMKDTDGDGVYDAKDKQINTPRRCFPVDKFGVGICRTPIVLEKKATN